jgi:hypothetical protein
MSYRADLIGAGFSVGPGEAGGTIVRCVVPHAAPDGGGGGDRYTGFDRVVSPDSRRDGRADATGEGRRAS